LSATTVTDLRQALAGMPDRDTIEAAEQDAQSATEEAEELREQAVISMRAANRAIREAERLQGAVKKHRTRRSTLFSHYQHHWTRQKGMATVALADDLARLGYRVSGTSEFVDEVLTNRPAPDYATLRFLPEDD
jgi:hypothetical protein